MVFETKKSTKNSQDIYARSVLCRIFKWESFWPTRFWKTLKYMNKFQSETVVAPLY